jgi:hypothetical protein
MASGVAAARSASSSSRTARATEGSSAMPAAGCASEWEAEVPQLRARNKAQSWGRERGVKRLVC